MSKQNVIKLFDLERSGNCYKIRLFLSILNIDYEKIPINANAGENETPEFLQINPNGFVPVLIDGEKVIFDSAAILSYLAKTYAEHYWFPSDPIEFSRIIRWLAFEQSEGRYGLARARAICLGNPTSLARSGSLEESQEIGILALETLERQLSETKWLAGGKRATICDIACYPYAAMGSEGGFSLDPYSSLKRWMQDIERLDGYIALPNQS